MDLLHEEPATVRSFRRPRGYAGDARLIDFLYEHPAVDAELRSASPRGRTMNAMALASATSVAVQERRRLLARLLDATAERGEASNEWGAGIQQDSNGHTATLRGKVGEGPTMHITSARGSISVRKEGAAPSDGSEDKAEARAGNRFLTVAARLPVAR